jgi:hypothetical protein
MVKGRKWRIFVSPAARVGGAGLSDTHRMLLWGSRMDEENVKSSTVHLESYGYRWYSL